MSNPNASPLSLGEYAESRKARALPGGSKNAVSKAIKRGCLVKSVVRDHRGAPKIADPELADREWAAGTDHSKAPASVKVLAVPRPPAPRGAAPPAGGEGGEGCEGAPAPMDLNISRESAREKHWKANKAEIEYLERIEKLVDAEEMKAAITDAFARVRSRLSGLPTRIRQQIPHLTMDEVALVEAFVREALEELVIKLEDEDDDEDVEPDAP